MVVGWKSQNGWPDAMVRIERRPGETQEHFDATKADAKYEVDGHQQTLELDGKIDAALLNHFQSQASLAHFISDIRQLQPHIPAMQEAAAKSEDFLASPEVDLGTGQSWMPFPEKDSKTHKTYEYKFINSGLQEVDLTPGDNGVVDLTVDTKDPKNDVSHAMRARFHPDGSVEPWLEGAIWHVAK